MESNVVLLQIVFLRIKTFNVHVISFLSELKQNIKFNFCKFYLEAIGNSFINIVIKSFLFYYKKLPKYNISDDTCKIINLNSLE